MDKDKDIDKNFEGIEKEVRTRFSLLPEDVQKMLISSEYQMKLYEIAKKEKLTYEQLGTLELETTMVLLGMTEPEEFSGEIKTALGIADATIDDMIKEINQQVFAPIRESMKKIYSAKEQADEAVNGALSNGAKIDEKVLEKSGIEIEKKGTDEVKIQDEIREEVGGKLNRNDLLKGIENPPKSSTPSFVTQKMTQPSSIPKQETSYTPKNITSSPQAPVAPTPPASTSKPAIDPYREIPG